MLGIMDSYPYSSKWDNADSESAGVMVFPSPMIQNKSSIRLINNLIGLVLKINLM